MSAAGFPALGFDPAPGDVTLVQREASRFSGVAREVAVTVRNLEHVDAGYWKGHAAQAFTAHVHQDLEPLLSTLSDAFTRASDAMTSWAGLLQGFQQQAQALEKRAEEAEGQVAAARQSLANDTTAAGAKLTAAERAAHQKLQDGVTDAVNGLAAVQREAENLRAEVTAAAQRIAGQLQHAGNMAPSPPGWLDSLFHDATSDLDDAWDWVKSNANAIKFFSDLMSDASAILQILAIITAPFEPLGAIFEGAALITGAIALLSALLAKAAGADESWTTIGLDVVSLLPGLGALKDLRGGVKVAEVGAEVLKESDVAARAGEIGLKGAETVKEVGPEVKIFGKTVGAFGKTLKIGEGGFKLVGFEDRASSIYESLYQNLRGGQLLGTKGLRLIGDLGDKLPEETPKILETLKIPKALETLKTLDQTSGLGRGIDAGVKIVSKAITAPHQIEKDIKSMGDSFGTAVAG